jgi:hypothetical protein
VPGVGPRWDAVNEFLVVYLDPIDERFLEYLDEGEELRLDIAKRLRYYTTAVLDGSITPTALHADWPDWFDLLRPSWPPMPRGGGGVDEAAALGIDRHGNVSATRLSDRGYPSS